MNTPLPANDTLPPVLAARLAALPPTAIERDVVLAWSTRDPVDAAMDAGVLLQRLRFDGPVIKASACLRRGVTDVHRSWTATYPPGVYLAAAERLVDHMNEWADSVIADAIADHQDFILHP